MFKSMRSLVVYTLFVIIVSSVITTGYFHYFVLSQVFGVEQKNLVAVSAEAINKSPLKENNSIVEIFSYGCHYCASGESDISQLEHRMPSGTKLIRLHFSTKKMDGLASYSPLFATLTVMGIEPQFRKSAYEEIIDKNIDLSNTKNRDNWLRKNGIDINAYVRASQSPQVKALLDYMTDVTRHYNINATPAFIVNKKWVALQDRDYPAFSDHLLSLLQHDSSLEQ